MINEEEKQKYCEATKCENCIQWHKYCNAECCKLIFLNIDVDRLKEGIIYLTLNPGRKLGMSDIRYYKYHDVEYIRGFLRFRKDRIHVIGRKVLYIHACEKLDGNMCLDHPNNKPELCKSLTLDTAKVDHPSFEITSNCLFKYKCKEVKE